MNQTGRPWYFWPMIAFVVGLLVGWLVIGWGLWPVTWTNALVQDLRPDLRNQYVTMVAESYAQTKNVEQARERLAGWAPEDLAGILADVQEVLVARDLAAARNVQDLASAIGAIQSAAGTTAGQPQVTPAAADAAAAPALSGTLRRVCTAGIFVVLALGALALLVFLFRRWRSAQSGAADDVSELAPDATETRPKAFTAAEQEKSRWPASETPGADERAIRRVWDEPVKRSEKQESRYAPPEDAGSSSPRPIGPTPIPPARPEPAGTRASSLPSGALPPQTSSGALEKLIENTAVYQMGEPDYDEAWDINDPVDGLVGQCGLQLVEPFGRERNQAIALQVWLWDASDPDTQGLVLMSEGGYRDTSLRSEHEGEFKAQPIKPGSEFELQSHDLLLKGRVEKISYAEAEPPRGIFAELQVKMTVFRRT